MVQLVASVAEKRNGAAREPRHQTFGVFASMMKGAGIASAAVLVVAVAVAIAVGPPGAVTAVTSGVLLTAVFFALGALGLRAILIGPDSGALTGALGIYGLQISGLFAILFLMPVDLMPEPRWFAVAALVEAVAWQLAQARVLRKARILVFTLGERPATPDAEADQ